MMAAGNTGEKSLVLTGMAVLPQALTNTQVKTSVPILDACLYVDVNLATSFTYFNDVILIKWF